MGTKSYTTERVLATIVLYNTSLEHSETFQSLSKALSNIKGRMDILIYDNSPSMMYAGKIHEGWNIHYIHDALNSGISKAYNTACSLAKKLDKKWLLLLDQDTIFPDDALQIYEKAVGRKGANLLVPRLISNGILVSPFKPRSGKGEILKNIDPGVYRLDAVMPVNSGLMVRVEDFEACGGYNESFPLDYSDFAFITRYMQVRSHLEVLPLVCEHEFSAFNSDQKASSLNRFRSFCRATLLYGKIVDPGTDVIKIIFSRALKLSLRFRSPVFLRAALQNLLRLK